MLKAGYIKMWLEGEDHTEKKIFVRLAILIDAYKSKKWKNKLQLCSEKIALSI